MKQKLAVLVSNIINPFSVSFFTIVLLDWHASSSPADAVKWVILSLVLSVIPILVYLWCQLRRKKIESIFPEGQGQRRIIFIFASVLAVIGCLVMWLFDAPELLTVSFIAGLVAVVIFMIINYFWRISLHSAFISAAAMVLTLVFGLKAAWLFLFLPLVGWSRLELKMHTPAQVVAGAILAAIIVTGVFYGFGVV